MAVAISSLHVSVARNNLLSSLCWGFWTLGEVWIKSSRSSSLGNPPPLQDLSIMLDQTTVTPAALHLPGPQFVWELLALFSESNLTLIETAAAFLQSLACFPPSSHTAHAVGRDPIWRAGVFWLKQCRSSGHNLVTDSLPTSTTVIQTNQYFDAAMTQIWHQAFQFLFD